MDFGTKMMKYRGKEMLKNISGALTMSLAIILMVSTCCMAQEEKAEVKTEVVEKTVETKVEADVNLLPLGPTVLSLDECIKLAIENNHELKIKQAILNSVDGDKMIDRSRFYSHVDFIADFSRDHGTLSKSYYPSYNPQPVSSLGTLDASSLSLSSGGASGGGFDLSSIAGVDISEISSLASSFGIDISQYLPRKAGTPAERRAAQRGAQQLTPEEIQDLLNNFQNNTEQLAQLAEALNQLQQINSLFGTSSAPSRKTSSSVAIRYSRRLIEWGKDSSSSVQIRANRRLAIYNYQQKLREIISEVRTTFFTILLKKQQISTREKLLGEYEEKLRQQETRFDVAQDVPKIDVLTAELDVLNEKNRINSLKADLIEKKYELLQIINMPLDTNIEFSGELEPLDTQLDEVVSLTKKNSFQITYLREEYKEDQREFNERAWDYKPIFSGRVGIEDKRTAVGISLNNANQTYGLDVGISEYANIPESSTYSSNKKDSNYSMSLGVSWNLFDNTHRKGISKKFLEKLNETKADLDQQIEIEELNARKAFNNLMEAKERLELQNQIVENAQKRLEITRKLREHGRVSEYQVDSYRDTFFSQQDRYFSEQENMIAAQESLRRVMGVFY